MRYLIGPLKGEEELWVVFWIYGVLISLVSMGVQLAFTFNPPALSPLMDKIISWSSLIIGYAYTLWVNISLWQCAYNTESKSTPVLIRFGVVVTLLFMLVSLFFDGFGPGMLPAPDPGDPETENLRKILEILQKGQY